MTHQLETDIYKISNYCNEFHIPIIMNSRDNSIVININNIITVMLNVNQIGIIEGYCEDQYGKIELNGMTVANTIIENVQEEITKQG